MKSKLLARSGFDLDLQAMAPNERARTRWQTACKLVKQRLAKAKITKVKLAFGEAEDAYESDQSELELFLSAKKLSDP